MRTSATETWILRNSENDNKYLAATWRTKFQNTTMGDLVPEQMYALRFYDRNEAAKAALEAGRYWRLVRLIPR